MGMITDKFAFSWCKEIVILIKFGFSYYQHWRQKKRDLRHLSELPDYLLDDIGLDQRIVQKEKERG
ncbi:DUF1127 domain-containing protein [Photobacterium sp. 1_MG-2023]|uniref:DUF1127 domain-containing protein n=1 Tax=Photobacterium sp. 1_MG-2023 TaxID=3062646 RepID=UPI0026E4138E|nr:DUF1127 domain-containing protein [Photobacterium sp. 1_MG-2023]MDO6708974.1 DUF1127 domain-containing protein [Photobacterium sp. 1_MG-2023]